MQRPPDWRPSPAERQRLLAFEGYGSDTPNIIFAGLEEYCDPDAERQRNSVWMRCIHPAFADSRVDRARATQVLTGLATSVHVPVWKLMAEIVAALTGRPPSVEYDALGSRPERGVLSTFLTELRPLPRPGSNAFDGTYIPEWFDQFRSARSYDREAELISGPRILRVLSSKAAPPLFAFFYGRPAEKWVERNLRSRLARPLVATENGARVGVTTQGTRIAITGFYNGQHAKSAFRAKHVAKLVEDLTALDAAA